jgi:hypothetical protein
MTPVDAVTHHHHLFLKAAYRHGDYVRLHNTADTIKNGTKYIAFDPDRKHFRVYIRIKTEVKLAGIHDNIESAICHIRRR